MPGSTKSVTLKTGSLSDIKANLKVMSLYDALKDFKK